MAWRSSQSRWLAMATIALLALIAQPAAVTLEAGTHALTEEEDPEAECDLLADAASVREQLVDTQQTDLVIQDPLEEMETICLDDLQTPVPVEKLLDETDASAASVDG